MKVNLTVQVAGKDMTAKEIETIVRDSYKQSGIKNSDVKSLDIYYIPEQSDSIHYVITDKDGKESAHVVDMDKIGQSETKSKKKSK